MFKELQLLFRILQAAETMFERLQPASISRALHYPIHTPSITVLFNTLSLHYYSDTQNLEVKDALSEREDKGIEQNRGQEGGQSWNSREPERWNSTQQS
jgi:hypothetical protein